jgi:hypothetical protein
MTSLSFFNPVIALLLICIIPMAQVGEHQDPYAFFRVKTVGHGWLISVDAVLVLCGAV